METNSYFQKIPSIPPHLPRIIVTGASGFIGRHFLKEYCDDFFIFAIARRPQKLTQIPENENICWLQTDLGEETMVKNTFKYIEEAGGADYVLHLAGYYDFKNEPDPEYERTNVTGTENLLKYVRNLSIKRFIFASSLTVTEFIGKDIIIDEKSPCDAQFPYAITKCKAEKLVQQYSKFFPCSVVRLAAIFSDWCEYGPLYMFISTWLSKSWKSRILAGKGKTSVPYLHVRDLNKCFMRIIEAGDTLPEYDTYIASPDGSTTHRELYHTTIKYYFHEKRKAYNIPKFVAGFGVWFLDFLGRLLGERPFERPWMSRYIDEQLNVNAVYTREQLGWQPVKRYHILRRLLFMLENLKSDPLTWQYRNEEALHKNLIERPNVKIYMAMLQTEPLIIEEAFQLFNAGKNKSILATYQKIDADELRSRISILYSIFKTAVRTGDRIHILNYARELSLQRFVEGFSVKEVVNAVSMISSLIKKELAQLSEVKDLIPRIEDEISTINQLLIDEIEDSFERITGFEDRYSSSGTETASTPHFFS